MPKSMTGYGRAQRLADGRDVLVEIRAVNHRYYEFSARLPRTCMYLEEKLKSFLNGKIARGKVEVARTERTRRSPSTVRSRRDMSKRCAR